MDYKMYHKISFNLQGLKGKQNWKSWQIDRSVKRPNKGFVVEFFELPWFQAPWHKSHLFRKIIKANCSVNILLWIAHLDCWMKVNRWLHRCGVLMDWSWPPLQFLHHYLKKRNISDTMLMNEWKTIILKSKHYVLSSMWLRVCIILTRQRRIVVWAFV